MTIAQLMHLPRDFAWQPRQSFRTLRWGADRHWSSNALMWRSIGVGIGFALMGLVMIALAISAASVAPPASELRADSQVVAHGTPNHHPTMYPDPTEALGGAMMVP